MSIRFNSRSLSNDKAVSEVLGTVLLIMLAVGSFTALSLILLNPWSIFSDESPPMVTITASTSGDYVVFTHIGGIPLSSNSIRFELEIDNQPVNPFYAADKLGEGDNRWNIGEQVKYYQSYVQYHTVRARVIDESRNMILFDDFIQRETPSTPYVFTQSIDQITEFSARVNIYYDFIRSEYYQDPERVSLTIYWLIQDYKSDPSYYQFDYNSLSFPSGNIYYTIQGLSSAASYEVWAEIRYNNLNEVGVYTEEPKKSFCTYDYTRGEWRFDEPSGLIAYDSSQSHPRVNGSLSPEHNPPQRIQRDDGYAISFTSSDQSVLIQSHDKLLLPSSMTIRSLIMKPDEGFPFYGKISELGYKLLNSSDYLEPDIIHTTGCYYAMAYYTREEGVYKAYIETLKVEINSNNELSVVSMDKKHIPTSYYMEPALFKVSDELYGVVFSSTYSQTKPGSCIVTFNIINGYSISDTMNYLNIYEYYGREPSVTPIGDAPVNNKRYYAISYGGDFSDIYKTGFLITISVNIFNGIVDRIDEYKFDDETGNPLWYCAGTDIARISGDKYIVAFGYGISYNMIYYFVFSISTTGMIDRSQICRYENSVISYHGLEPSIILLSRMSDGSAYFAVAWGGGPSSSQSKQVVLRTIFYSKKSNSINDLDLAYVSSINMLESEIVRLRNQLYCIVYSNTAGSCFLHTFNISDTGVINSDIYQYTIRGNTTRKGFEPACLVYSESGSTDRLLVVFGDNLGFNTNGFLSLFEVIVENLVNRCIAKDGSYSMVIRSSGFLSVSIKDANGDTITIDGYLSEGWNHVVLVCDNVNKNIFLYINTYKQGSSSFSGGLKTTSNPIVIGYFPSGIDEVKICSDAWTYNEIESDYNNLLGKG